MNSRFQSNVAAIAMVVALCVAFAGMPSLALAAAPDQWVSIGPSHIFAPALPSAGFGAYNAVGRLTTIAVDPTNPNIIYAASAGQLGQEGSGIWKTTDGGSSWSAVGDNLPPASVRTLSIGSLAIDPSNHNHVYAASTNDGLYHSTNGGSIWTQLDASLRQRSNTAHGDYAVLLVNPQHPMTLYATSDSHDGVKRSDDGGQSFNPSLSMGQASALVMDPLNPDILYAAVKGVGVWRTGDGGVHWYPQVIPAASVEDKRIMLALSHPPGEQDETVYALFPRKYQVAGKAPWTVWDLYSTIGGATWSLVSTTCESASNCFVTTMAADPDVSMRLYMGGGPLWVSEDGGGTFTLVPANANDRQPASPHGDYWELVTDPTDSDILYAGSDGGIYRSTDHGAEGSWSFIGNGIANAEMYDLALATPPLATPASGALPTIGIASTQDNGNIRYDGNPKWEHMPDDTLKDVDGNTYLGVQGGDGSAVAIDPTDAYRLYAGFDNNGAPFASLDDGGTFESFVTGLGPYGVGRYYDYCAIYNMTFHLQLHPANPTVLLESCLNLWQATLSGPVSGWTWSKRFDGPDLPGGNWVNQSAVQDDLNVYYAGTTRGTLYAGINGANWQQVFQHPESLFVSDLETDPLQGDTLYGSFAPITVVDRNCSANAGVHRVYQFTRDAVSPAVTVSSVDITSDLPAGLCVNTLAIDPAVAQTVYAGTNKGVYRGRFSSANGSWTWAAYNEGMPLTDVRDLEVQTDTGHIFAATFGRSAYEVEPQTNLPPELTVPGAQSIDFHDSLSFGVSATDPDAADALSFSATGLPGGLVLIDHGDRTATVSGVVTAVPGVYAATISVDDGVNPAVSATVQITVTKEQTVTKFIGPLVIAAGLPATLHGRLLEDGTTAIQGRTLTLSVGAQKCTGTTDATGAADCVIANVSSSLGSATVGGDFAGDAYYLPSSDTGTAIVFAFPASGVFVLGDTAAASVGTATPLTYWSGQWSKVNALSGGKAPAGFKGFASTLSAEPPACGETWTTSPANSSAPVAGVPLYMGVAVTDNVIKTGHTLSGSIVGIVVIKTGADYAPNPGHSGTGTLVATYCAGP